MTRVRTDNVFGTVTDNPLTAGATTLNSAGLANLAAVSSAEAIIILDPNRVSGAPEIVVVTAHTGSATSATITRGQFGTSAREHAAGTEWVHGPIASNASSYATAADDQGDFVPMNAWESWTPTFVNFTLGNGTIDNAKFVRIGRTVHYRLKVTLGTTSAMGTAPSFSLPVDTVNPSTAPLGIGRLTEGGGSTWAAQTRVETSGAGSTARIITLNAGTAHLTQANVTASVPFTWGATDIFEVEGTYEAAA